MTNKMFGGSGTPRSRCLILLNSPNLMVKGVIDPCGIWDMATGKNKGKSTKIAAGKSRASHNHVVRGAILESHCQGENFKSWTKSCIGLFQNCDVKDVK